MQHTDAYEYRLILMRDNLHHDGSTWVMCLSSGFEVFHGWGQIMSALKLAGLDLAWAWAFITPDVPCEGGQRSAWGSRPIVVKTESSGLKR